MPQLRLPVRFLLRSCSVWSSRSFPAVHGFSSSSSSLGRPASSSELVFSAFSVGRCRPPGFLRPGIFALEPAIAAPRHGTSTTNKLRSPPSSVTASAARTEPVGPSSRCLLHSSGVCSQDRISQHDRNDGQWIKSARLEHPVPRQPEQVVSTQHEPVEDEAPVDGEEVSSRSALVYETEARTELYSATSRDEDSDSEVDFEEGMDELEEGDDRFESGYSQLEEEGTKRAVSESERLSLDAASEGNENGSQEGSGEGGLNVGKPLEEHNGHPNEPLEVHDGHPHLHILSVDDVCEILEKARAKDVRIVQVRECCEWVDQLVFASGRSARHLRGMADALVYKVKQSSQNVGPNSFPTVEGRDGEQWMAVDCGNIVVHLFLEDARSYYDLEEFWRKRSNQPREEAFSTV